MSGGVLMDLKSEFSIAFVRAIAHAAGLFTDESSRMRDATGIDLRVFRRGPKNTIRNPELGLQVKCTSEDFGGDTVGVRLLRHHYEGLRETQVQVPRRLVVVQVPQDPSQWLRQGVDKLEIYRAAWWHDVTGAESKEQATITIAFSRSQVFDRGALINEFARLDPSTGGGE